MDVNYIIEKKSYLHSLIQNFMFYVGHVNNSLLPKLDPIVLYATICGTLIKSHSVTLRTIARGTRVSSPNYMIYCHRRSSGLFCKGPLHTE